MSVNRIFKYVGNDPTKGAEHYRLDWDLGQRQLLASIIDYLKEDARWSSDKATQNTDRILDVIKCHEDKVLKNVTASVYNCATNPEFDRQQLRDVFIPIFWAREGRKLAEVICQAVAEDEAFD